MAYRTEKNILTQRDVYNRYYGDFRGVDFSSDHTLVNERRLAYAVNMYRDYQSGQGQAIETITGFRKRIVLPEESEVYGIFNFSHKDSKGIVVTDVLIHSGNKLYLWGNYPNSVNVILSDTIEVPAPLTSKNSVRTFRQTLSEKFAEVVSLSLTSGLDISSNMKYNPTTRVLTYSSDKLVEGDRLLITYKEGVMRSQDALFSGMNERKSTSFIINNRLYIIDGKNYLVYDGKSVTSVLDNAYIPTTYVQIVPSGEKANIGAEYEQRNILQPKFRHTFIADGETTVFHLNENRIDEISEV